MCAPSSSCALVQWACEPEHCRLTESWRAMHRRAVREGEMVGRRDAAVPRSRGPAAALESSRSGVVSMVELEAASVAAIETKLPNVEKAEKVKFATL